jgi:hypothetical protein
VTTNRARMVLRMIRASGVDLVELITKPRL